MNEAQVRHDLIDPALTTGVDACNVRSIVLMREVKSLVEFKQIIGRGTRLYEGKPYFVIYDFTDASDRFQDDGWDGPTICPQQRALAEVILRNDVNDGVWTLSMKGFRDLLKQRYGSISEALAKLSFPSLDHALAYYSDIQRWLYAA